MRGNRFFSTDEFLGCIQRLQVRRVATVAMPVDMLSSAGQRFMRGHSRPSQPRRELPVGIEDLRVVHIGGYWRGPNDVVRQMLLGLRQTGARVLEVSTDEHRDMLETRAKSYDRGTSAPVWIRRRRLSRLIGDFDPHVIVCNAGGLGFRRRDAEAIKRRSYIVGIALSDPDVFSRVTSRASRTCDLFFTNAPACIPGYKKAGVRVQLLRLGTYEGFYRPVPPRAEYRCDVLVFGSGYPHRVAAVKELVRRFDTHVHGDLWEQNGIVSRGCVYGEDSLAVLSSARLTVVFGRTRGGDFIVKPYLFDYAAAGATVVAEYVPEVEEYFIYGREVVGFRGTQDLVERVHHLLAHPDEVAAIREAGRRRVLREHTWKHRWPEMLEMLRSTH